MEKIWIESSRTSKTYRDGAQSFINFARVSAVRGEIKCPCLRCCNRKWLNIDIVHKHILSNGFVRGYTIWSLHGEQQSTSHFDNHLMENLHPTTTTTEETHFDEDDIRGLLHDALRFTPLDRNPEIPEVVRVNVDIGMHNDDHDDGLCVLIVKLCLAGKDIIKEEDFDELTFDSSKDFDVSSISGSDNEDEKVSRPQTFFFLFRYVVRGNSGKKQSAEDGGGKIAHSAGSPLRRYNELALKKKVLDSINDANPAKEDSGCHLEHRETSEASINTKSDKLPTSKKKLSPLHYKSQLLRSRVDLHSILSMVPVPLSQGVLLSLLQQLACDINKDTSKKLTWMTDVAATINPADQMIAVIK
ncbi:hypothetical protein ACFE04_023323 [Oxalis oulophora]